MFYFPNILGKLHSQQPFCVIVEIISKEWIMLSLSPSAYILEYIMSLSIMQGVMYIYMCMCFIFLRAIRTLRVE